MRRSFSREFKLGLCEQIERGELTKGRASRENALSYALVERWVEQYKAMGENAFSGQDWRAHAKAPESKITELEAALGRAHLEIEFMREALGKLSPRSGRKLT
jgi:transposase-like protein